MGRSIRNKVKSKGGGVSNAQLAAKADTSTVSSLQTAVDNKTSITNVQTASGGELTGLTIDGTAYTIASSSGSSSITNVQPATSGELSGLTIDGTAFTPYPAGSLLKEGCLTKIRPN